MTPASSASTANDTASSLGGDFSGCDREPIQIPGSIQPHGMLLALQPGDLTVLQFSANCSKLMRVDADRLRGKAIDALLPESIVKPLREAVDSHSLNTQPLFLGQCRCRPDDPSKLLNAIAHARGGVIILELETVDSEAKLAFNDLYAFIRDFVSNLQHAPTPARLAALASAEVRKITGFDRVLVYQFDEEWNGTVVGESLNPEAYAPYMDLRFPAADIPRQARELYRLNRWRLIVDANYQPVPLVPPMNPLDGRPLDLSFASLRSVSPVHVEYLKNMNAMASMSISILKDGQLWGLIACHHRKPLQLSFEVRTACDFIGQVLSVQLAARQLAAESEQRVKMRSLQALLLSAIAEGANVQQGLLAHESEMLQFADAGGAAIAIENTMTLIGQTPTEAQCRTVIDWLAENVDAAPGSLVERLSRRGDPGFQNIFSDCRRHSGRSHFQALPQLCPLVSPRG